jgi:hypothetical protein
MIVEMPSEMRQVLADMEVWLAYGSTTSWGPSTGSGDGYGCPPGEGRPPHVEWRERWMRASVLERDRILREAKEHLKSLLHQKRIVIVEETQDELEKRVVAKCRQGWSIEEVANEFKVTKKFVRIAYATAQTRPDEPSSDKRVEAQRLAAKGMTERQIEMLTKLPKSTLRRVLGRAA